MQSLADSFSGVNVSFCDHNVSFCDAREAFYDDNEAFCFVARARNTNFRLCVSFQ